MTDLSTAERGSLGRGESAVRARWGAVAAAGLIGILVAGVPALLLALTRALPLELDHLGSRLLSPDDGGLLLLAIAAIAWASWAVTVLSLLVEAWSVMRCRPTRRIRGLGGPQRLAAALIGMLLLNGVAGPAMAAMPDPPGVALGAARAAASSQERVDGAEPVEPGRVDLTAPALPRPAKLPTVVTHRHDTLWGLAEKHLGDGSRYPEIVDLNRGLEQPDGRALQPGGRIYPGWTLVLPADATVAPHRDHVVHPGESLWSIAQDELGRGAEYPVLFEANRGIRQQAGGALVDPEVILPGWVLQVPGDASSSDDSKRDGDRRAPQADPQDPDSADGLTPDIDRAGPVVAGQSPEPAPTGASAPTSLDSAAGTAGIGEDLPDDVPTSPDVSSPAGSLDLPPVDRQVQRQGIADGVVRMPAGGVMAALLMAGFAAELTRRRRQYQRHRVPGERMAAPGPAARAVEEVARVATSADRSALLERCLDQLVAECARRRIPVPDIRLARVSAASLLLVPAPRARDLPAVPPFVRTPQGDWLLDPHLLVGDPVAPDPEGAAAPALPGLITLGTTGDETLLVNLESIGTLSLRGEQCDVEPVLRALAAELAFGRSSRVTSRTLCVAATGLPPALEPGDMCVETSRDRVRAVVDHHMAAALARVRAAEASTPIGSGETLSDGDPLEIFLVDGDLGTAVAPRSGCGLIAVDADSAGMVLSVDDGPDCRLEPDGIVFECSRLMSPDEDAMVELLVATDLPALPEPETPGTGTVPESSSGTVIADIRAALGGPLRPGAIAQAPMRTAEQLLGIRPAAPRVLVLGGVVVREAHGRAESSRIGRLSETAAFVALNPGARPSDLQSALWPGRRSSPQTCRQMISRTRTWLGRTEGGQPYLMPFAETGSRLRMRDEVTTDWGDFQALAARGLDDPGDVEYLTAALSLVRGRPFGSVAARELPWADVHINDMLSLITDVAHELALRQLRRGNVSRARDAALRGLTTESEAEALEAVLLEVPM